MADPLKKGIGSKFLLPIIVLYVGAAALLEINSMKGLEAGLKHASIIGVFGLVTLVFQDLIPRAAKEVILFWRLKDRLPGCRAFSIHAIKDQRIDQTELQVLLPGRSMTPSEQNSFWYKWLKELDADEGIADNHRRFLILRDCACLLLILSFISPMLVFLPNRNPTDILVLTLICTAAYLLTMIAGRNAAERLICNVIAAKLAKS